MLDFITAGVLSAALAGVEFYRKSDIKKFAVRAAAIVAINFIAAGGLFFKGIELISGIAVLILVNFLYILSIDDIQTKEIRTLHLNIMMLCGAAASVTAFGNGGMGRIILFLILLSVLYLWSRREKSGIGSGDAKAIAAISLYITPADMFVTMFLSLAAALIYGIIMILRKKGNTKTTLPFIPFLLIGTVAGIWC